MPKLPKPRAIELLAIRHMPEIHPNDNLLKLLLAAARKSKITFQHNDILVLAQKIISKSENRLIHLSEIHASAKATELAARSKKDPRLIEVILRESRRVVRGHPVLIVETHHGLVCANAGVDQSNIPGQDVVSLLPKNPDATAKKIARSLRLLTHKKIAVIISDTFGRPWRLGLTNVAIGAHGIPSLIDLRNTRDANNKPLHATIVAVADELAAAAGLAMQKSSAIPAVIIRNYAYLPSNAPSTPAAKIIRPASEDLFR